MKEQHRTPGAAVRRAAAATTLVGLVVAMSAAPAQATPAQATAVVTNEVLVLTGTAAADQVTVDFTTSGTVGVDLGHGVRNFDVRTFRGVSVDLGSADDDFRALSGGALADLPIDVDAGAGDDRVLGGAANDTILGGSGEDFLLGGAGSDVVFGDNGADFVNGGVGVDTEVLGSGDDTAAWNPGEGNDVVLGGLGRDTLAFNGSGGDEQMSLATEGSNVVFRRVQGTIRMDLVAVERLDLATLGGADTVTVDDLSGTALTTAEIDLSVAGAPDTSRDSVIVNGTEQDDHVIVDAAGGAVHVGGLRPETVITGSDSRDELHVNTLGGPDQVEVTNPATLLIGVLVDFGSGQ
jgi:Ca2+-binding RTX toxin-like protein